MSKSVAGEAAQLIADNACAHQHRIGPAVETGWQSLDLAAHAVRITASSGAEHQGSGAAVLGEPRDALSWLANELADLGDGLRAGEVVMTGTSTIPLPVRPGDDILADFGELGTIGLRIAGC